jgi:hypothetical protein
MYTGRLVVILTSLQGGYPAVQYSIPLLYGCFEINNSRINYGRLALNAPVRVSEKVDMVRDEVVPTPFFRKGRRPECY